MKNVLCISAICLSLLSGCAVHRKLFYTEAEMKQYNAEEQAKQTRENAIENAITIQIQRVFNIDKNDVEKYGCKFISTENAWSGWSMSRALQDAKEITVRRGGNATRLLMSSVDMGWSNITFEVWKCEKSPFDN
jgi:transcription initiation factor TFIIIB Brf1 subunit/transcription initiation factor TFIIB